MKSILLVEDDKSLGFVTKDNLELNGLKVTLAEDGIVGWDMFNSGKYDLCILDVMLPKMDGFTLAEKIRYKNAEIPIIFLTAKSMQEDKIKGLTIGGDDYLTKPFSMEELLLRINVFLKRTSGVPRSQFRIGEYFFEPERLSLQRGGKTVVLTQKENAVLRIFCERKGEVIKREDILNEVWGDDDYFMGRSLDVFISRLRKYLKGDPEIKIENYHGVGFRLKTTE